MITFRPVRGGFDESIRDSKNFYCLDELYRFLLKDKYDYYVLHYTKSIEDVLIFTSPRFDYRLKSFVSLVIFNDENNNTFPCGYVW